jgi:thiosulfate/3-mercaptopyruvate sulfurtransferase
VNWLKEHLESPSLVLLHVGGLRREYQREHIPGARYLWGQSLYPSSPEETFGLPPEDHCERVVQEAGIGTGKHVVLYDTGESIARVARVFVTLEYFGVADTMSILDGGLQTWKAAGLPVTVKEPPPLPSPPSDLHTRRDVIVTGDWVLAHLHVPGVKIIDARSRNYFAGERAGQRRGGRIPGAGNVPFDVILDEQSMMKSPDSLRVLFSAAGADPNDTIATYCHIGLQASLVYVAARYAGYPARLYDGSFEDWGDREELPVEGPDATKEKSKPGSSGR